MEATTVQIRFLRHMLGAEKDVPEREWGYRNYYAAKSKGLFISELLIMEASGLVKQGHTERDVVYFHATEKGVKLSDWTKNKHTLLYGDKVPKILFRLSIRTEDLCVANCKHPTLKPQTSQF